MKKVEFHTHRSRLFELRTRLLREVTMIEEELREDVMAPGDPSPVASHPADQDVEGLDAQVVLAQNEEELLEDVEAALLRIEAGTYGNCQQCGRAVSKERLDAMPQTPWCIDCARGHDSQRRPPK